MSRFMDDFESDNEQPEENLEIFDEWYAKDIQHINDPVIRAREIENAEKIRDREQELDAKLESGEISDYKHWSDYEFGIRPQKVRLATRTALASVDLSYDMLGDVSEDWDILVADDQRLMGLKNQLKSAIERLGVEAAQELADKMLAEEKISEKAHQMISRQTRLNNE